MGGGSSAYLHAQMERSDTYRTNKCQDKIPSPLGVVISSLMPRQSSEAVNVNHKLMRTCIDSWRTISAQSYTAQDQVIKGASVFASYFFIELANIDPCNQILNKMKSANRTAAIATYERNVLMKMLFFVLNIKDDSFATKTQIRSVGRKHARIGVRDESIAIFNEAILRTLAVRLDPSYLTQRDVISSWAVLLQFVRVEMTIEKVQFHNCNSGKITSSCHNQKPFGFVLETGTVDDLDISCSLNED